MSWLRAFRHAFVFAWKAARGQRRLTQRQKQVVSLVKRGMTNKEIARRLAISPETVKDHLNHLYRRLGVHDRSQLRRLRTGGKSPTHHQDQEDRRPP